MLHGSCSPFPRPSPGAGSRECRRRSGAGWMGRAPTIQSRRSSAEQKRNKGAPFRFGVHQRQRQSQHSTIRRGARQEKIKQNCMVCNVICNVQYKRCVRRVPSGRSVAEWGGATTADGYGYGSGTNDMSIRFLVPVTVKLLHALN